MFQKENRKNRVFSVFLLKFINIYIDFFIEKEGNSRDSLPPSMLENCNNMNMEKKVNCSASFLNYDYRME